MDNQEIFNMLSSIEESLYYRLNNPETLDWRMLRDTHENVKTALIQWHALTGCTNQ